MGAAHPGLAPRVRASEGRRVKQPHVVVEPLARNGRRRVRVGHSILGDAYDLNDVLEFGCRAGAWVDVDLVDIADDRLIEWHGG